MTAVIERPRVRRAPARPPVNGVAPSRAPQSILWRVGVYRGRSRDGLGGRPVVVVEPHLTVHAPRIGVLAEPRPGRLTRASVANALLELLPAGYRARPCLRPCSDDGDCWLGSVPGEPQTHHDCLGDALTACVTHYRKGTRR